MIRDEDLIELQQIIKEDHRTDLTLDQTRKLATHLINLFSIILEPHQNQNESQFTPNHQ